MRSMFFAVLLSSSTVLAQPALPSAPAFSPALDAPHTMGQPGYTNAEVHAPRGTDRRVLPPTREPGLWASDAPQASSLKFEPFLQGLFLEAPDGIPESANIPMLCAVEGQRDLRRIPAKLLQTLPSDVLAEGYYTQRHCLAARLYLGCVKRELATQEHPRGSQWDTRAALASIAKLAADKCRGPANTEGVSAIVAAVDQLHLH